MKSMQPPLKAIFFMTYFYRALGGEGFMAPSVSAGSATENNVVVSIYLNTPR